MLKSSRLFGFYRGSACRCSDICKCCTNAHGPELYVVFWNLFWVATKQLLLLPCFSAERLMSNESMANICEETGTCSYSRCMVDNQDWQCYLSQTVAHSVLFCFFKKDTYTCRAESFEQFVQSAWIKYSKERFECARVRSLIVFVCVVKRARRLTFCIAFHRSFWHFHLTAWKKKR